MGESKIDSSIVRDQAEYSRFFPNAKKALETALDVRKFEIDLYWKRAAYFWTFIAVTFVGFGAAQQLRDDAARTDLSVVSCCLGIVFSFAWFCINKGSKYWQVNWEKHVDMLEDDIIGPLYKVNWIADPVGSSQAKRIRSVFLEFDRFSVTRINQLISLFVLLMWIALLVHVVPINPKSSLSLLYVTLLVFTVAFCILIATYGQTGREKSVTKFTIRGDVEQSAGKHVSNHSDTCRTESS
jgi:hypothetical protein